MLTMGHSEVGRKLKVRGPTVVGYLYTLGIWIALIVVIKS